MKRVLLVGVIAALSLMSCSNATGPVAIVSATVTRLTMGSPGGLDAMLEVEMSNATSYSIYLATCAMSLERQDDAGDWDEVWSLACALITSTDRLIIPPGESRTIPVRITASRAGEAWPSVGLEGRYRLRLNFFPDDGIARRIAAIDGVVVAQPVVSNEFVFLSQL